MPRLTSPLLGGALLLAGSVAGYAQTSTVTTGPNGVSSSTTGGPSVTTRSGNGSSSSSASSSSSGGTTMTTTGDGDCVVTVPKGK